MHRKTRSLILAALFAALTAVGAFLRIPMGISSLTLQFFFTCLAGVLLGPRYGALSQAAYVLLGLAGLPIFTQGGGLGYLVHPTCGFLFGLIPAAALAGGLTRGEFRPKRVALASLAGLGVLYLIGLPYMHLVLTIYLGRSMTLWDTLRAGMLLFLPGDFLKIGGIVLLSPPLGRALSRI